MAEVPEKSVDNGGYPPPDLEPSRRGRWPERALTASDLSLIAGLWLIGSAFAFGYVGDGLGWLHLVAGGLIVTFAIVRMWDPVSTTGLSVLSLFVGAALVLSAPWLDAGRFATWSGLMSGGIILLLGAVGGTAGETENRRRPTPAAQRK